MAAVTGRDGRTGGSDCGDVRGTIAPLLSYSSGLDAVLPPYSERWSNSDPQDFPSNVDKSCRNLQRNRRIRPAMSRLTAETLRKAHAKVRNIHKLRQPVPEGLALLDRDYAAWRRRVQRGTQPETLLPVPWSAEVRDQR